MNTLGWSDFNIRISCPECERSDFKNMQGIPSLTSGFSNHCRSLHQIEFPSHAEVAKRCGVLIDPASISSTHPVHKLVAKQNPLPMELSFSLGTVQSRLIATINVYDQAVEVGDSGLLDSIKEVPLNYDGHDESSYESEPEIPAMNETFAERDTQEEGMSRFHITRKLVVGNTSQHIPDSSEYEYRWTTYLRYPNPEKNTRSIFGFVKKVRFFLHPDYKPNDVIDVTEPPFELTRHGWGGSC